MDPQGVFEVYRLQTCPLCLNSYICLIFALYLYRLSISLNFPPLSQLKRLTPCTLLSFQPTFPHPHPCHTRLHHSFSHRPIDNPLNNSPERIYLDICVHSEIIFFQFQISFADIINFSAGARSSEWETRLSIPKDLGLTV